MEAVLSRVRSELSMLQELGEGDVVTGLEKRNSNIQKGMGSKVASGGVWPCSVT